MLVNSKIKKAVEKQIDIAAFLKRAGLDGKWDSFTRTRFNQIAHIINRRVSVLVIENPDVLEAGVIMGYSKLEEILRKQGFQSTYELIRHLSGRINFRPMNWISGKTLQSYWHGAEAKNMKVNVLLLFLGIDYKSWDEWITENDSRIKNFPEKFSINNSSFQKSSLGIVRNYYLGQYFLYYQKTDNSANIIKTPFIIKENAAGTIIVQSVSEGHRYLGKILGIRDGCLYINCQNLDFEEIEQYIFNIGLETKPEILFGVSNTVSVKNRLAVALKNILVKQHNPAPRFEEQSEVEISFTKNYLDETEESLVVGYLKKSLNNVIVTANCCSLEDLRMSN